ncbi:MAG: 4-hydroxy-3-methylbut-2-enyl diphosphate reductase [Candidatus Kapabacteria bacterium]|nr:4-hydroxy-3-methylbut-2-enyl diphosphate reductase [Ignavibacteriota bacterium]MCW5884791.1 4-hydroxy-3-methylbut-2-enyl diphosphate reductase [Candidatus Kapabacteria bacterium]
MKVTIDEKAGFCWGVVRTVDIAEETLNLAAKNDSKTYILGHIIHNPKEISRLEEKGLTTITHDDLEEIAKNDKNAKVIIRAHGEPPSTYKRTADLGMNVIDATCPLVTNLQNRVRKYYELGYKIIIFGKKEHAEVIGLRGVCNDECTVIKTLEEAKQINDFERQTIFMSQTTMDKHLFHEVKGYLESKINNLIDLGEIESKLIGRDTTCRAVTSREEPLLNFAKSNDVMIFVSGKNSSNGKSLYNSCLKVNPRTYFVEDLSEIDWAWFENAETVGISGATSTPQWYMENVKSCIENKFN